mmetsp:Transcript_32587/g.75384  ORF Transcript_32587/g.75384 Transcript_32587/m.75384 type:complete len:271 (+) Transcript_32587:220-1032(+)
MYRRGCGDREEFGAAGPGGRDAGGYEAGADAGPRDEFLFVGGRCGQTSGRDPRPEVPGAEPLLRDSGREIPYPGGRPTALRSPHLREHALGRAAQVERLLPNSAAQSCGVYLRPHGRGLRQRLRGLRPAACSGRCKWPGSYGALGGVRRTWSRGSGAAQHPRWPGAWLTARRLLRRVLRRPRLRWHLDSSGAVPLRREGHCMEDRVEARRSSELHPDRGHVEFSSICFWWPRHREEGGRAISLQVLGRNSQGSWNAFRQHGRDRYDQLRL